METHGLLILSGTCNLLYSQCSALSTVAFISVFFLFVFLQKSFVWHYCVAHIVKVNMHFTGIIVCTV